VARLRSLSARPSSLFLIEAPWLTRPTNGNVPVAVET
jgi:hypothetical protein